MSTVDHQDLQRSHSDWTATSQTVSQPAVEPIAQEFTNEMLSRHNEIDADPNDWQRPPRHCRQRSLNDSGHVIRLQRRSVARDEDKTALCATSIQCRIPTPHIATASPSGLGSTEQ